MSLFSTRAMLKALEQVHKPSGFILNTFVNGSENHTTNVVEIDIVRHGKKMAPFVSPVREGRVVKKEGFETKLHKIPYSKMKRPFDGQETLTRLPGNTIYQNNVTPAIHIAKEMRKTLAEFDQMFFRREEKMASECIQTGKVVVSGDDISYEVDFGMKQSHLPDISAVAGDRWTASTADIIGQLEDLGQVVYDDSGLVATDAIIGKQAERAMRNNETFIGSLDRRRIDRGEINVKKLPQGVKYLGYLADAGLDLWTYTESFFDENSGTMIPLIDEKKVVVGSRNAMFKRHYGLIQNAKSAFVGARYPSNWFSDDPVVQWVMLESAPLVALHQPDAFACAKVID